MIEARIMFKDSEMHIICKETTPGYYPETILFKGIRDEEGTFDKLVSLKEMVFLNIREYKE